ncbi:MAG TPA: hypothetical protein VD993_06245 [Chitinophagaceae bacterium]|nr:hypothetical protein [Chitinophagaceae bacterium]
MKTILAVAAIVLFCGCYSFKEMQVQMVNAELIRIDTVYRYERQEQVLTWRGADRTHFVSYAGMGQEFIVGSRVTVFVRR